MKGNIYVSIVLWNFRILEIKIVKVFREGKEWNEIK